MNCGCPNLPSFEPSLTSLCGGIQFLFFMGIVDDFIRRQCDLEDPCNRFQPQKYFDPVYDFVVIGGGSAGATLAGRLADLKFFSVLLIEAGLDEPAASQVPALFRNFLKSDIDWQYYTEPDKKYCRNQKERRCYWPRGKVLGGSGAINAMIYMRGAKQDYDEWARMGNPGWSYDDVLPYFIRSENNQQIYNVDYGYHGVDGPLSVSQFPSRPPIAQSIIEAGKELGYDYVDLNGRNHTGFSIVQATIKNGHRQSPSRAFLRPLHHCRRNLHLMLNSTVTKILFDNGKRATAVEFYHDGLIKRVGVRKEVIVSAGAINSPQILLNSGIGPAKELEAISVPLIHHLPGVGLNLQDHVGYTVNAFINETDTNILNFDSAMEYLLYRDGPLSQPGLLQVMAMINTKYANFTDNYPDIQLIFGGYEAECSQSGLINEVKTKKRTIQIVVFVLRPKSQGYLRLRNNDPLSKPLIYPNYFKDSEDVNVLIEGIKLSIQLIRTEALTKYGIELDQKPVRGCGKFEFGTDLYWKCAIRRDTALGAHQQGTCKMGPSHDSLSVVDNQLRVHGLQNVRVVDTSIIPKSISGNTMATAIMIGEKAAEFIKSMYIEVVFSKSGTF